MTEKAIDAAANPPGENGSTDLDELKSRVGLLEAERSGLQQELKQLHFLVERIVEHRQKSHAELVLLLTGLVSKLPINDVGVFVSRLVEHNASVTQMLGALTKGGTTEVLTAQPEVLKTLDQTKRDLRSAIKSAAEQLIGMDTPLEKQTLEALISDPDTFFSPRVVRANRCFIKGLITKERVLRDFGEPALMFFNDMTTDPKLNPHPKPDEIVLAFKPDFEALFQQQPNALPGKREALLALYQRVQCSKAVSEQARSQRNAFARLSFYVELLHFYENQSTEAPDVIFAQRLPALIEQLVVTGPNDKLDEALIKQAETLLGLVVNPDYRLMVINNIGKGGGAGKTLRYVLRLRLEKSFAPDEVIAEFIRHLLPGSTAAPQVEPIAFVLRFLNTDVQLQIARAIMFCDRLRKQDAEALGKALASALGLQGLERQIKAAEVLPPEVESRMAWGRIKEMIATRTDPASIAAAIRDRLHARYDADEIKQSWITLIEADPMSLIRIFCQLPYRSDGTTDAVARTIMETYVSRLTHEKYAGAYTKVVNSLKNMFKAKPDSPTLLNFIALTRWVSPEAAERLSADIGLPVAAH
jgi:hypothetical protein